MIAPYVHVVGSPTDADVIGKVGVCSRGRIGLITRKKVTPWGESFVGIGLDDGTAWASRTPTILSADEVEAYAEGKASK